jgi:hypothetical protein
MSSRYRLGRRSAGALAATILLVALTTVIAAPTAGADDPWQFTTQPNPAAGGDTLTTDITLDCPVELGPSDVLVGETLDGSNAVVDSVVLAGPGGTVSGPLSYSYLIPIGAVPGLWHRTITLVGPGTSGPPECLPFGWGVGGQHSMAVEVVAFETPAAAVLPVAAVLAGLVTLVIAGSRLRRRSAAGVPQ